MNMIILFKQLFVTYSCGVIHKFLQEIFGTSNPALIEPKLEYHCGTGHGMINPM